MKVQRRRWWPDLLLGAAGAALGFGKVGWPPAFGGSWAVLLGLAAGLLLAGVRRWPLAVFTIEAVLVLVADSAAPPAADTAQLALEVALGFVAYTRGWPVVLAALAAFYGVALVNIVDPGVPGVLPGRQGLVQLTGLAVLSATPIAFGRYLRAVRGAARVAEERIREAEARRAVETRAARLAERASIARDLHDIVAHHIGAIALQAGAAQFAARRARRRAAGRPILIGRSGRGRSGRGRP